LAKRPVIEPRSLPGCLSASRKRAIQVEPIVSALFVRTRREVLGTPSRRGSRRRRWKAIRDLASRWQKALLERDADVQASMFADDGVSYHDDRSRSSGRGDSGVESRSKTSHPKAIITATTEAIRIAEAATWRSRRVKDG
jgi:hypothetical protein